MDLFLLILFLELYTLTATKYSTECKIIVLDFSGGADIYATVEREIKELEIGVLSKFIMLF